MAESDNEASEAWTAELSTADEIYGAEDPVQVALEYVQGVLLGRIADPVERWEAVIRFTEAQPAALERVRALCVGQLVADGMSVQDAGRILGINRQRANALLSGHDQPTPRKLKANPIEQEPGYRLGAFLGVASLIADALQTEHPSLNAADQLGKLERMVHQSPQAITGQISRRIAQWTHRQVSNTRMKLLLAELELATNQLGSLPRFVEPIQQGHMWVARSRTRIRLSPAR